MAHGAPVDVYPVSMDVAVAEHSVHVTHVTHCQHFVLLQWCIEDLCCGMYHQQLC